ncbi:unnamed protein product [Parnassius apollo]|uniref:(apollo) hypothetical protein n=1 Tax=Parnassius apollo TaxID=110799 RepID=A0A8S3WMR4_PARAO|nr:unnamed protein product [Parnassius apollo]
MVSALTFGSSRGVFQSPDYFYHIFIKKNGRTAAKTHISWLEEDVDDILDSDGDGFLIKWVSMTLTQNKNVTMICIRGFQRPYATNDVTKKRD